MPSRALTNTVLVVLVLIWGNTWAAIRIGLEGIPPILGVALRFAIASVILVGVAWWLGVPLGGSRRVYRLWAVNGALTFSASYGVVYWGEQYVPSGLTAVLFATFPLFVVLFAHFWLPGERMTWRSMVGVLIAFVGILLVFSEDLGEFGGPMVLIASLVLLISPLVSAVANVLVKRWGAGVHPLSLTAVPMGLAALFMGGLSVLVESDRPVTFDLRSVGALLFLSIFGSAITFSLYFWLLEHMEARRLALIAFAIPVVAVVTGTVFLREPLTGRILMGSLLVVAGVAFSSRRPRPAVGSS